MLSLLSFQVPLPPEVTYGEEAVTTDGFCRAVTTGTAHKLTIMCGNHGTLPRSGGPWPVIRNFMHPTLPVEVLDGLMNLAQLLGHSTIQMTMRYAHLAPEHGQEAGEPPVSSPGLVTKSANRRTPGKI